MKVRDLKLLLADVPDEWNVLIEVIDLDADIHTGLVNPTYLHKFKAGYDSDSWVCLANDRDEFGLDWKGDTE